MQSNSQQVIRTSSGQPQKVKLSLVLHTLHARFDCRSVRPPIENLSSVKFNRVLVIDAVSFRNSNFTLFRSEYQQLKQERLPPWAYIPGLKTRGFTPKGP